MVYFPPFTIKKIHHSCRYINEPYMWIHPDMLEKIFFVGRNLSCLQSLVHPRWFGSGDFSLSTMVNHRCSPPFGEYYLLFSNTLSKSKVVNICQHRTWRAMPRAMPRLFFRHKFWWMKQVFLLLANFCLRFWQQKCQSEVILLMVQKSS